jgi:hypothetical protein
MADEIHFEAVKSKDILQPSMSSSTDGITPNQRLATWAESRNLSIDTASIIPEKRNKGGNREAGIVNIKFKGAVARTDANKASDDASTVSRESSSIIKKTGLGCFTFLSFCRPPKS